MDSPIWNQFDLQSDLWPVWAYHQCVDLQTLRYRKKRCFRQNVLVALFSQVMTGMILRSTPTLRCNKQSGRALFWQTLISNTHLFTWCKEFHSSCDDYVIHCLDIHFKWNRSLLLRTCLLSFMACCRCTDKQGVGAVSVGEVTVICCHTACFLDKHTAHVAQVLGFLVEKGKSSSNRVANSQLLSKALNSHLLEGHQGSMCGFVCCLDQSNTNT